MCGIFSIVAALMPWLSRLFGMSMFVDAFMSQFFYAGSSHLLNVNRLNDDLWKELKKSHMEETRMLGVFRLKMIDEDVFGEEDEIDGEERKESDAEGNLDDPEVLNLSENDDSSAVTLDDLSWRVEKLRLEEANTRRFLKSGPRFLPYEECRKWVQAWNRWDSEKDWKQWIDEGEKRNSYIPARPDEYYGRLGKWISWDHFLGIENDDDTDENNSFE